MKKNRFIYGLAAMTGCCLFIMLSACAVKPPAGKWIALEGSGVYFSGAEMNVDVKGSAYPEVCIEAKNEINSQLLKQMPAQLRPLDFQVSQRQKKTALDKTVLQVEILKCEIDVDQSGGVFEFYLTLDVDVMLKNNGRTLMKHRINSFERVQIAQSSPSFEFSFEDAVARILRLFNKGRVLIAG